MRTPGPRRSLTDRYARITVLGVLLLALFTYGPQARAYILRGPHLLEMMTQRYGAARTLMVFQTVRFYEPASAQAVAEAEETLRYLFPSDFRSDSSSRNATRIHLVSGDRTLTIVDEKIVASRETSFDLYKDILLYRTREALTKRLTRLGIDTSLTCLGRFNGRVAVVLGSEKPDEPVSQLWVDKETLRPVRWRLPPSDVEFRYDEWRQVKKAWYPMAISMYRGGVLEREIRVQALRVDSSFPDRLFDTELMEVQYLRSAGEHADESVDGELSEIEKTIDDFRKRIEE